MATPRDVECKDCGSFQSYLAGAVCALCGSQWLEPNYDYATFKREILKGLPDRPRSLWRYHEVLPLQNPFVLDLNNVGWTPLQHSRRYGPALGFGQLYIKDERFGPTSSFKDRQALLAVAHMLETGVKECVIASTGNAAVAYAAACAQADIRLWVFMTSMVPREKLRETALFGAEVVKVTGSYDDTKKIAAEFAQRRGILYDRGAHSIPARESMKTIAYEIVEQLGWRAPDWYVQAVSGGLGPLGVYHGFEEMFRMGIIDRVPKLAVVQAEGCSPMVQAFAAGAATAAPVIPETRIAILSTGDPGKPYTYLRQLVLKHGGTMTAVSDGDAFRAMRFLAKTEGMAVEPATAVAFAGFEKMIHDNTIRPDELVVVNCTGHTFPVEKHVLGDQWQVEVDLSQPQSSAPKEGLVSALQSLDEKTTTVLVVDDNPDDALLIRRFLESRKSYRVFTASDGQDALQQAQLRLPDLIILDLMMPVMDGLTVIRELKQDDNTRDIPVIVVSAKDTSLAELRAIGEQVEGVYQKGTLPVQQFVAQVVEVLEAKNRPDFSGG